MRILIHGLGVPTKSMKIEPPHFINDSKKLLFVTNEKPGSQIKRYEMLIKKSLAHRSDSELSISLWWQPLNYLVLTYRNNHSISWWQVPL